MKFRYKSADVNVRLSLYLNKRLTTKVYGAFEV